MDKEDVKYGIVRKYVRDNPGASILEVSEATKIDEAFILRMVNDGRLKVGGYVTVGSCQRCGKRISEGTYCETCHGILNSELRSVIGPGESKASNPLPTSGKGQMYIRPKK
jgi:ferredoxin